MFFERYEVRLTLGCLMLMFPRYVQGLENGDYSTLRPEHITYYRQCIMLANEHLLKPENKSLLRWIRQTGRTHVGLQGTTDYAYSGLLYQLFEYQPFQEMLDTDLNVGVVDIRPSRNLAKLSQIIGKFEYLHRVDTLNGKYININTEKFFNLYIRLLYDGGITEYEDDSEYAPSGCVSFLTIHQSKGMEFPIVVVDSLSNVPRTRNNDLMLQIEARYFKRPAFEPYDQTKYFDFWRLYYTAFSRAQDLLILTCNEDKRTPSNYFREQYGELQSVDGDDFQLTEFDFKPIKDVNLKRKFAFTSNITVYDTCALQYKFYKELEFMPVRANAMLFGTLVHETIEDIHRAAIRHPTQKPEELLKRIISIASNPDDIVFDCFMGSGTTQAVAMKLGRRFIGADINLGAIQTTTKRLVGVANELNSQMQEETKYTGFEVYDKGILSGAVCCQGHDCRLCHPRQGRWQPTRPYSADAPGNG